MNVTNLTKVNELLRTNSPAIFAGLGVSGVLTTGVLAAQAGYKTGLRLRDEPDDLSLKEKAKKTWKLYIPAVISGAGAIGCIVASAKVSHRRAAAAAGAYSITERAFSEYREKMVEVLGENKEERIHDEIIQKRIDNNPPTEILMTGNGEVLCCELYTRRYFRSTMENLRRAMNDINAELNSSMYATLADFYYIIGLPPTSTAGSLGWTSDKLMDLRFTTTLSEDGQPCLAFEYNYVDPL